MLCRIHFTVQDLARTRVVQAPAPLLELNSAARALRNGMHRGRLDAWRRRAFAQLTPYARMPLALIRPGGWSPDFLSPPRGGRPEELLEQVRATPRERIKDELALVAERQPVPSWAHHLADDRALFDRFVEGLAGLYTTLLGPYESRLADLYAADRTARMRHVLSGGVEHLLTQANPRWWRWKPPVLEIQKPSDIDHTFDVHLRGRGLLLVPSAFAVSAGIVDGGEDQSPPVVLYPAGDDQPLRRLAALIPDNTEPASTMAALLGHTRAAVLTTVAEHPGCSTKELAALAGIAPASASEHATVLRRAGLIATTRHRNTALHNPTALGISLLGAT